MMLVDDVINWYDKNVNYKLTKSFMNFLIKVGIIKSDSTLEDVNLFLLERYGEEYVKENGLLKIKKNRIDVIKKFPDSNEEKIAENAKTIEKKKAIEQKAPNNIKESSKSRKFKIESLGGKKLKLIKL